MDKDQIMKDKLTKVCLCRGIDKHTIKECIKEGAKTVEDVREKTGATGGGCKGSRCRSKIKEMLEEEN